jgi:ribose 5-phosphate isomerase
LPPFKRLNHKEMQEMSMKNLPGVTSHGYFTTQIGKQNTTV